jgi:drug/metabolite transporter (DMT)-like permease
VIASIRSSPLKIAVAFACIYLIWGSTYLAIRFAIETLPPLLMAGVRFLIAGAALYAWVLARGEAKAATGAQWLAASVLGGLFFLGGNGGVSWAEQFVPSGLTALLIATVPLWMVVIEWARPKGSRPTGIVATGLLVGLAGVALLVGARGGPPGTEIDPAGAGVLMIATLCWAMGSIFSRYMPHPSSHLQSGAMQMLAGGALLCLAGLAGGESARVSFAGISPRSLWSFVYLVVAGSLIGFTAFNWLLHATTPARVGTYAYVNPVVAVFAGWALGGETIGPRTLVAGAIIIAGVVLIITARGRGDQRASRPAPARPLTSPPTS